MPRGPNPAKVKEWKNRLDRFEQSGQSIAQFCENEEVSTASFFQWRKKLKTAGQRTGDNAFLPVQITPPMPLPQTAVIRLADGIEIELGNDPRLASTVVETLVKQVLDRREASPC